MKRGTFPEFTSELAIFNSPLDEQPIGQGLVVRSADRDAALKSANDTLGESFVALASTYGWNLGENILQSLKSVSIPKHNWWVINVMSIIYVGLVFPGWYLLSRGSRNYRTTILAFLGLAVLFTFAFNLVGRRGYGESTTVNTLAVARKIDGSLYDVFSWTDVFVTGGDKYALQFEGEGHLFATASLAEKVAALIDNGLEGQFLADIPLYSSRAFMHRGAVNGPEWKVEVVADGELPASLATEDIRFKITPPPSRGSNIYAVIGEGLYRATKEGDSYRLIWNKAVNQSLKPEKLFGNNYNYARYGYQQPEVDVSAVYNKLKFPAVSRDLGFSLRNSMSVRIPSDQLRLLIYDDLPEGFSVKHPDLGTSQGKVLYSLDVRLPKPVKLTNAEEKVGDVFEAISGKDEYEDLGRDHIDDEETESSDGSSEGDEVLSSEAIEPTETEFEEATIDDE